MREKYIENTYLFTVFKGQAPITRQATRIMTGKNELKGRCAEKFFDY